MILLDTCTLLWLSDDQGRLSAPAIQHIAANRGHLYISAISMWEIVWKHRKGKLALPQDPQVWLAAAMSSLGIQEIAIDREIAVAAALLPEHHKDPCDRILIATAQARHLTLVTPDPDIHRYENLSVVW